MGGAENSMKCTVLHVEFRDYQYIHHLIKVEKCEYYTHTLILNYFSVFAKRLEVNEAKKVAQKCCISLHSAMAFNSPCNDLIH